MASSSPRVAKVVEASPAVRRKPIMGGRSATEYSTIQVAPTKIVSNTKERAIPAKKSRPAAPLQRNRSPREMNFPIRTTGWGSQRGSPTARSKRKALTRSVAEEFKKNCQSMRYSQFTNSAVVRAGRNKVSVLLQSLSCRWLSSSFFTFPDFVKDHIPERQAIKPSGCF